ncbi:F0F1 ATP synthase subunit B [Humidisolicoccus flavus]|uniref:F0F1 ATP synthase subunit B n=1 Tax=Humidisolicoccus flavus TaxID=3111414 RepID=UPI00324AEA2B
MPFNLPLAEGNVPEGIGLFIPAVYDVVWSLVPFAGIMAFFVFFAIPRFRKIIDERAAVIEGGIKKAENAQAEAQAALEDYNRQLAEARAEASNIREQARVDGGRILSDLKTQAQADADRITQTAHDQIEAERQAALASLKKDVGSLALDLASSVIGETLDDNAKANAVVDRFLTELESEQKANG